jgi:hypothetical protein
VALHTTGDDDISGSLSILVNDGHGGFSGLFEYSVPDSFGRIVAGDLKGDGKLDLAIVGFFNDLVSVVFGTGDPTTLHVVSYPAKTESAAIAIVDVNGDSRPDIIFADDLPNTVSVLPATCLP